MGVSAGSWFGVCRRDFALAILATWNSINIATKELLPIVLAAAVWALISPVRQSAFTATMQP